VCGCVCVCVCVCACVCMHVSPYTSTHRLWMQAASYSVCISVQCVCVCKCVCTCVFMCVGLYTYANRLWMQVASYSLCVGMLLCVCVRARAFYVRVYVCESVHVRESSVDAGIFIIYLCKFCVGVWVGGCACMRV